MNWHLPKRVAKKSNRQHHDHFHSPFSHPHTTNATDKLQKPSSGRTHVNRSQKSKAPHAKCAKKPRANYTSFCTPVMQLALHFHLPLGDSIHEWTSAKALVHSHISSPNPCENARHRSITYTCRSCTFFSHTTKQSHEKFATTQVVLQIQRFSSVCFVCAKKE